MGDPQRVELTDAQVDRIAAVLFIKHGEALATRTSALVVEQVQLEIGKGALRALLYVAGAAVVALVATLAAHGWLKP